MTYSSLDSFGEAEYYMTCIVAAVEFIDCFKIPDEIQLRFSQNMFQSNESHEIDNYNHECNLPNDIVSCFVLFY